MVDWMRSPLQVAPALLGAVLRVRSAEGAVAVRLTEVEAYLGPQDPASHAYRGPTPRAGVMFGPPGRLYVYLSYGMHHAVNVVCSPDGVAGAVLLRAGEVVEGVELARSRRGDVPDERLACGPGCLGAALGLVRSDTGTPEGSRWDVTPASGGMGVIRRGPRVGISVAADVPWRFWLDGEATVSAYRRGGPRGRSGPGGRSLSGGRDDSA